MISLGLLLFYMPFIADLFLTLILGHSLFPALSVTSTLLLLVNCSVNWVIYGIMNTAFRQNYAVTLRRLRGGCCLMGRAWSSWRARSS